MPLLPVLLALAATAQPGLTREILAEINFARTRPQAYAERLRGYRALFEGKVVRYPGNPVGLMTSEGVRAVDEAIRFLERQASLPPLEPDRRIAAAARQHAQAQGARGDAGHGAAGGLGQRLRGQGVWAGLSAENISYGFDDARDVVRQLIIDSGVPGRGHRRNIFASGHQLAGVACGPHRAYGFMCVIDFAGSLAPR